MPQLGRQPIELHAYHFAEQRPRYDLWIGRVSLGKRWKMHAHLGRYSVALVLGRVRRR